MPDTLPWLPALARRFLVFEGPDGCGKSTQLRRLMDALKAAGVPACEVREPGGTAVGERIRAILLDRDASMSVRCEMLLYMASRAQLVEERIRPALDRGEAVIADRFISSTIAYQGAGLGLDRAAIDAVAAVAVPGIRPDLVIVFDADPGTAARRAGIEAPARGRGKPDGVSSLFADRIESRGVEFRQAVRESYLRQAREEPARHLVIDASGSPDEVWSALCAGLSARAGAWR